MKILPEPTSNKLCGRYKRRCCSLIPAESDSLPHAHAQTLKTTISIKIQESRKLKYRVLIDLILHRSLINNSASLSNKFGGFYFSFKFGISGLLHHVVTAIADRIRDNDTSQSKQNFQSSLTTFITFQDLCLRQELLVYMCIHNNDASESSKPSWEKMCTLMLPGQLPGEVVYTTSLSMVCEVFCIQQVKTQKSQAGVQVSRLEDKDVIFSIGSTLEDFICVVYVLDRNII
ncbi:hypothetical protein Tco_0917531, partial [Tanacetum coccineum]